jgi:hypothetical protein
MGQHQRGVGGKCAQDMGGFAVVEVIEAVTQSLAIDGDVALPLLAGLLVQDGGVTPEHLLDRSRIQLLENDADRAVGRRASPFQAKDLPQAGEVHINEAVDSTVRVRPGHHRQDREQHDVRQAILLAFRPPRVLDLSQQREKRLERLHGNLGASESGCLSKSQRFCVAGILYLVTKRHFGPGCGISDSPTPQSIER